MLPVAPTPAAFALRNSISPASWLGRWTLAHSEKICGVPFSFGRV
jgi:hypothetical protein